MVASYGGGGPGGGSLLVLADRVKVTSQTSGTGTMNLGAPVFGFQSFAAIGDGNSTYYGIIDNVGNWEIGLGTWTELSNTLSRDLIVSSSNNNEKVTFAVGSKNVYGTFPSSLAQLNFTSDTGLGNIAFYGSTIDTDNSTAITINKDTTIIGDLTITGTVINGNAATATRLATPRAINGVNFDGSADITVTAAANTLTGNTLHSTVTNSSLTQVGTITSGTWSANFGEVSGANLTNLTADNLVGTIPEAVLTNSVLYVGTTEISLTRLPTSQLLTGIDIDGNSASATALETARYINGVSFDGREDITIPASSGTMITQQNSSTQLIGTGFDVVIEFDTVGDSIGTTGIVYDGVTHVGRFTNESGVPRLFIVSATVVYAANGSGYRKTFIRKNGGAKVAELKTPAVSGDTTAHTVSTTVLLNNFDYIEVYGFQNCGANLNTGLDDDFNGNRISIVWA